MEKWTLPEIYTSTMARLIDNDTVATYERDGVVCLRQAVSAEWIRLLHDGLARQLGDPTERSRVWNKDDAGRTMFYDSQAWLQVPEYQQFVLESPMAELAASLMRSSRANFFFDAVFVRSSGNQFRTPFHQDEPYWSVSGFDTCSAWMPLVPVDKASALELVRGSHRWHRNFELTNFGALTGDERDQVVNGTDAEPFPNIDGDPDSFDIVSWTMEPGDVVFFNGRTIHGGSGNLAPGKELRVFNTKWLGDDARVCFRESGMDPDHSGVMAQAGLAPGDVVTSELYPQVWPEYSTGRVAASVEG